MLLTNNLSYLEDIATEDLVPMPGQHPDGQKGREILPTAGFQQKILIIKLPALFHTADFSAGLDQRSYFPPMCRSPCVWL